MNVDIINAVNVDILNQSLLLGNIDQEGVLPRLDILKHSATKFQIDFGLSTLPKEPGVIIIRGGRQFGKSTWLEGAIHETITTFGPGSALMLDGDHLRDFEHLATELSRVAGSFAKHAPVRRLFIDEITAISDWQKGLKRVLDRGELQNILVVTTGSHASDLRHGTERLPGRKGKLSRTTYLFVPISFTEFHRVAAPRLGDRTLASYLLSGGSPPACAALVNTGQLPIWTVEAVQDWMFGECARAGKSRRSLVSILEQIHVHGGSPLGQTKLAKEAALANNTVAASWVEFLADLLCLGISPAWDASSRKELPRKAAKFPFVNLLAASVWAPEAPRSASEFFSMTSERQGVWHEWAVAQELFRQAALRGVHEPERIPFWRNENHEIDFVRPNESFVEVKRGRASALEYAWFRKIFPHKELTVVCSTPFESDNVRGITLHDFLSNK